MKLIGENAKKASYIMSQVNEEAKNQVLNNITLALEEQKSAIIEANKIDLRNARENGLSSAMCDRLMLDEKRIDAMINGVLQVIALPDPVNKVLEKKVLDNGLSVTKVTVPLGVIGIIYESRPNVTLDAFTLCFKSGNVTILKGGKEAITTNTYLEKLIRDCLALSGVTPDAVQLIKSIEREATLEMMKMKEYIDVLIPRGGQGLIQTVIKESTIPVIETGAGNCHIYIDESADLKKGLKILKNAKLQRLSVCNAAESVVVHRAVADRFIPMMVSELDEVTFYGDKSSQEISSDINPATDIDYFMEYLDKKCSVKIVDSLDDAITHINHYHTAHSDAIITEDEIAANKFLAMIDAACVYVNASTRFTDGFEMGLGAEIGISTQKLHARGPMGLQELTSYKYLIQGKGQVRD